MGVLQKLRKTRVAKEIRYLGCVERGDALREVFIGLSTEVLKYLIQKKPVLQFDKITKEFVRQYDFLKEVREETKIGHISSACLGHRKTAGGYIWKYKKEK